MKSGKLKELTRMTGLSRVPFFFFFFFGKVEQDLNFSTPLSQGPAQQHAWRGGVEWGERVGLREGAFKRCYGTPCFHWQGTHPSGRRPSPRHFLSAQPHSTAESAEASKILPFLETRPSLLLPTTWVSYTCTHCTSTSGKKNGAAAHHTRGGRFSLEE